MIWHFCGSSKKLELLNKHVLRWIIHCDKVSTYEVLLESLDLVSLRKKRFLDMLILVHKSFQAATPAYISVLFSLHLEPTLIGLEIQTSCSYRVWILHLMGKTPSNFLYKATQVEHYFFLNLWWQITRVRTLFQKQLSRTFPGILKIFQTPNRQANCSSTHLFRTLWEFPPPELVILCHFFSVTYIYLNLVISRTFQDLPI